MAYDKQKYFDWCVHSGVDLAFELAKTDYCTNTGCNADGFGLRFTYDKEIEDVVVRKLLPCGRYSKIGIGTELQKEIEDKYGGLENLRQIEMERLYYLWGGIENYYKLFGNMKGHHDYDFVDTFCWGCGSRLSDNRVLCRTCSKGEH